MKTLWVLLPHGLENTDGLVSISVIDRAEVAYLIELTAAFKRPSVVACGGFAVGGMKESDAFVHALPQGKFRIYFETKSRNTVEQARRVLAIAKRNDYEKVVLICWDKHIRRAAWTFRQIFAGSRVEVKSTSVPAPYSKLNRQKRLRDPFHWHVWNFLGWVATIKELYLSSNKGGL